MKRLGLLCALLITTQAFAIDGTWTGSAGDGYWTNTANWAGGTLPSGGGLAIFDGTDTGRIISPNGISGSFAGIRVTRGVYTINPTTPTDDEIVTTGPSLLYDIAPESIVTNKMKLNCSNKKLIVTGGGELAHGGNWLWNCSGIAIQQGIFSIISGVTGDGISLGTNAITVAANARLNIRSANPISNEAELDVAQDGMIDWGNYSDVIGGINGAGLVTNFGNMVTFTLSKKPYSFSGIIVGGGTIQLGRPEAGFKNYSGFELLTSNVCTNMGIAVAETNALRFGKSIGRFFVRRFSTPGNGVFPAPFALNDVEGRPIVLMLGDTSDTEQRSPLTGSGSVQYIGSATDKTLTFRTNMFYTGATVVAQGNLKLGDGVASGLPENTSEYQLLAASTLYFLPTNTLVITPKVTATNGAVRVQNNGRTVTFNDLRLTNAYLYAGTSGSSNKVIVAGGAATNTSFRVETAGAITISGGRWTAPNYRGVAKAPFELAGGFSTNFTPVDAGLEILITGGEHWSAARSGSGLGRQNQIIRQTGGISGFFAPQGFENTNKVFTYVSGGTMYTWNASDHTRGLGLDLSGNGKFIMLPSSQPLRVSSDGVLHDVTIRDNGYMEVHWLRTISKGAISNCTATLNINDQGVLAIRSALEFGDSDPTNRTFININGGTIRQLPAAIALSFPTSAYSAYTVFENGAKFDLGGDSTTVLYPALLKGSAAQVRDAGLQVTGIGVLDIRNTLYVDGPMVFSNASAIVRNMLTTPFVATTNMTLAGSVLDVVGPGGDTSALTMTLMPSGGVLNIGPGGTRIQLQRSGRTSLTLNTPEIIRLNGGLLPISAKSGAANLGTLELLKPATPPALSNGIVLTSAVYGPDESRCPFNFVTYNATNGFVPFTAYSNMVKQVTTSSSISETSLTGLRIDGATATLTGASDIKSLILNNTASARAIITGGSLAITDETILWFNSVYTFDDYSFLYRGSRIESPLQGSGILQIAASAKSGGVDGPYVQFVPASPNFSGTVRIHSGRVEASDNGAFGSGTIEVLGNAACGGTFISTRANATYTNAFRLNGMGWGGSYGALVALQNLTLNGPVELLGDTRMQSLRYAAAITLNDTVSGAGRLEVMTTAGRVVLKKPSTYRGGTLITRGILEVASEGTLGAGEVVNNGVLIFSMTADAVVTNDISGTGGIWIAGPGKITFTGKVTCQGGIQALSTGSSTASGAVSTLGSAGTVTVADGTTAAYVSGTGVIATASGTLTINGGNFGGTISGNAGLTKSGLNTLTLYGKNTYAGTTYVAEGTLRLSASAELLTDGLQYRLDAQNTQSLTTNTAGLVSQWNSQTSIVTFSQSDLTYAPRYKTNGINGLPSLYFAGLTNRMYTFTSVVCRTVFIVNSPDWPNTKNLGGIWGRKDGDGGIRRENTSPAWQFPGDANSFASWQCYINGIATANIASGTPHVLSVVSSSAQTWSTAIGDYWGTAGGQYRSYAGDIGEVLVYSNELYPGDRSEIEQYLINRWNLPGATSPTTNNVLPALTALVLADTGTLDLNGIHQSVASLSGGGALINSGAPATLTVGSDNTDTVFSGSLGSAITLVKVGTGTLRLTSPLPASMKLKVLGGTVILPLNNTIEELEASGTVDLDGSTLTVARLSGSGAIIDGALRVTQSTQPAIRGSFATLTLPTDTQLAGALTVRIGPNGVADKIQSAGTINLAPLGLTVLKEGTLNSQRHTIVQALTISGAFTAITLPNGTSVSYSATQTDILFSMGTQLILR